MKDNRSNFSAFLDGMKLAEETREILNTYKWIKVPKYVDDPNLSWKERYKKLEEHHIKETEFLIAKTRELAKKLYDK